MSESSAPFKVIVQGTLRGRFGIKFAAEASRRGKTPSQLANELLEIIARDNLYLAVLDE